MTPGRKFSITTWDMAVSSLKIRLPSAAFKLIVTDCLPAFTATNDAPINFAVATGSAPSLRAKSPYSGCSILITSAPSSTNWKLQKGPARTLVTSKTRMPSRGSAIWSNYLCAILKCLLYEIFLPAKSVPRRPRLFSLAASGLGKVRKQTDGRIPRRPIIFPGQSRFRNPYPRVKPPDPQSPGFRSRRDNKGNLQALQWSHRIREHLPPVPPGYWLVHGHKYRENEVLLGQAAASAHPWRRLELPSPGLGKPFRPCHRWPHATAFVRV